MVVCYSSQRISSGATTKGLTPRALQTDWMLTPLIQYAKPNLSNNALHQQPNHSQENGTVVNASYPSPEKSAVSDAQQSVYNTNHMANMEQSPSDE